MKKVLVITHSKDADGWLSREIARKYYGDRAEYVGWNYGDPTPAVSEGVSRIVMIDISVPELMDWPDLVWIDHHATAIEKYSPDIDGVRLDGVAACRLAWQWFFGARTCSLEDYRDRRVKEPLVVRLAGEYDIFDHRDARVLPLQHGLKVLTEHSEEWQRMLEVDNPEADFLVSVLLQKGMVLEEAKERENASIIRELGFTLRWKGLTFLACNAARYNSLLFTAGLKPEHDAVLGFKWNGVRGRWMVSMYGVPGKPGVDLGAIAKQFPGGGGHKQACGFECDVLPFALGPVPAAALAVGGAS